MRLALLCALGAAVCGSLVVAEPPNGTPKPPETILHAGTREVVLDMIVRDKHGHLVTDLKPDQVQVYEDGVRQTIKSFRFIQGNEQLQAEKAAQTEDQKRAADLGHPLNSTREVNFVSIVFAPMSSSDLPFARDAALQFLKSGSLLNTFVTIYRFNTNLQLVQPYTNNTKSLAGAIRSATGQFYTAPGKSGTLAETAVVQQNQLAAEAKATGPVIQNPLAVDLNGAAQSPMVAANVGSIGADTDLNAGLAAQSGLEDSLRFVESQVNGMDAMDALKALVRSQAHLDGRKVVIYLSDGLSLPAGRSWVFNQLISTANRAGVTFYTIDSRGLSRDKPAAISAAQLNRAIGEMQARSTGPMTFDSMHPFDDVDIQAVSNTQAALGELAHATGGFAVANTNEIAKPMQRVMEDIRTHYEISYTPTSTTYDGHFRKITVKIADRRKLKIQTRSGYYALPELNGEPIEPFEMAALKAVREHPLPQNVAYNAAFLQFRPGQNGSECELGFEIPISGLKVISDAKTGQALIHASIFALVHDAKGQIVDKVSQDLTREVPVSKIPTLRQQSITYVQPVELPAGHYTIDTAVVDEQASKASAKRFATFVNAPNHIALSSITVIKQVQPLKSAPDPLNPFDVGKVQILPAVNNQTATGKPTNVYFVVYPAKAAGAPKPTAIVELFKDGAEIGRSAPPLPSPIADGSIPVVEQLSLGPGQYQLRVTIQQRGNAAQSSASFTVE